MQITVLAYMERGDGSRDGELWFPVSKLKYELSVSRRTKGVWGWGEMMRDEGTGGGERNVEEIR